MRASSSSRERSGSIRVTNLLLLLAGYLVLTLIVLSPTVAEGHVLDEAGTASMDQPPVAAAVPADPKLNKAGASSSNVIRSGGGVGVPGLPAIRGLRCLRKCASGRATRGAVISIRGENLDRVVRVGFRSKSGQVRVRFRSRTSSVVRAIVPRRAVRGHVIVIDTSGRKARSPRALTLTQPTKPAPTPTPTPTPTVNEVFPVRGPFSFGSSGSRFGAPRSSHSHQGQDMSASCGTRLVSVKRARVVYNQWDDGAGNYIVLNNIGTNQYFVYMHLIRRPNLRVGQIVGAGKNVGRVGNTGRSYGCHLHFEYWVGPWQTGGSPIDPLPYLRSLLRRR